MAEWLEKGRKKMKVTYKTYCKGHDRHAQAIKIEAEKKMKAA